MLKPAKITARTGGKFLIAWFFLVVSLIASGYSFRQAKSHSLKTDASTNYRVNFKLTVSLCRSFSDFAENWWTGNFLTIF